MNVFELLCLIFLLVNGDCAVYSIDVATEEKPIIEFQSEVISEQGIRHNGVNGAKSDPLISPPPLSVAESVPFVGTIYFQGPAKYCLSSDETALMTARQGFELLVPKSYPNRLSSNGVIQMLIRYWNVVDQIVHQMSDKDTVRPLEDALYDTLGGYLRSYLVPVAQVSYYAGRLSLNTVERLLEMKRECHTVLNTDGLGWRAPAFEDVRTQLKGAKIEPVELAIKDDGNSCDQLDLSGILKKSDRDRTLLPLPKLEPVDDLGYLTNIYLPFRQNRSHNLRSAASAPQLKRFLQTIAGCHRFLSRSQVKYNHKVLNWMQQFVPQHLADELFYPGLGGILQIQESLKIEKKVKPKQAGSPLKKADDTAKQSRSIGDSQEKRDQAAQQQYMDDRHFVIAFLVLIVVFIIIVSFLHCRCLCGDKWEEKGPPYVRDDLEAAPVIRMTKPKRLKERKERKERVKIKIKTPRSPLKDSTGRRYYGHSSDDCSTSTLGYHFKEKLMPLRFEHARGKDRNNSKYTAVTLHAYDMERVLEDRDNKNKKAAGRYK